MQTDIRKLFKPRVGGFTLIELMVAMTIIAVLVMVGYGMYITSIRRSQNIKRQADMKVFQTAMEQYYSVNQAYPATQAVVDQQFVGNKVPVDPVNDAIYKYTYSAPNVNTYCACALLRSATGNATNESCVYGTGNYFCVENLQ